jgi:hypothetical protein
MAQQLAVSFECKPVREAHADLDSQSPAVVVVETVAEIDNVDPTELPPLADTIDPDVVDQLVTSAGSDSDSLAALCFTFSGWNVFVRADGTIIIGDPAETNAPTPLF